MPLQDPRIAEHPENTDTVEHLVGVRWIKTVAANQAIKEKGFFGNQNTVARPREPNCSHTVERLRERFGIPEESQPTRG